MTTSPDNQLWESSTLATDNISRAATSTPARRFPSIVRWLFCILALVFLLIVHQGCSDPVQRYHVLSMFFDGVPVPPGVTPPPEDVDNPTGAPRRGAVAAGGAQTQPAEANKVLVYHAPYRRRQCSGCHDQGHGNLANRDVKTCGKCHTTYAVVAANDWVHGPLVTGQCGLCHEAHQSEYPRLLTADVHTLCNQCHGPQWIQNDQFHSALKDPICSDCHDPHAAGNRLLLADSRTYERRLTHQRPVEGHTDWRRDDCGRCHLVGQANQLRPNVDAVCVTCHPNGAKAVAGAPAGATPGGDKAGSGARREGEAPAEPLATGNRGSPGGSPSQGQDLSSPLVSALAATTRPALATTGPGHLHQAVSDGKCTTCHSPHRSILPHLVKPTAEKICLSCHKLEELRKGDHPNVTRVNCVLCHNGHESPRPHLLRPGIPEPEHMAGATQRRELLPSGATGRTSSFGDGRPVPVFTSPSAPVGNAAVIGRLAGQGHQTPDSDSVVPEAPHS